MLGFGAISESAISALPDAMRATFSCIITYTAVESDDRKLYTATEPYIARIADTPSGQPFDGTLEKLPNFDRSIIGGDGFSGLTNAWGNAQLINADGLYDAYSGDYAIDGRRALFKAVDPTLAYSTAQTVADLIATSFTVDGQFLTVGFQDKSYKLNVPTQPNAYQGTGGLEGGTELTGKRKPLCFGRTKNISPVLLISSELVLQVSDGAVSSISAVFDLAYPLTATSDYATPTLLRAATIADGSYATCLVYGLLRMGGAYSQLTCDVNGDATNTGYVETTGTIIRRIIALTGCISDPADIDTVSFANLELVQPAPIQYYLDANSTETVAQTFDRLSKGIGGFCGFTRLGMLQAGVFTAPNGTPIAEYTDHDIIGEINVENLPSSLYPPPQRVRAIYDRNWTVIENPVAGAATADADRAAWVRTPYRVATTSEAAAAAILEDHLQAQDPAVHETFFALYADAYAYAVSQLTLANSGYQLYRILFKVHPFQHDVCQTVRVTSDRLGFDSGKLLRIPAISDIPDNNTVELRVFG